jgi:hypothetical protein
MRDKTLLAISFVIVFGFSCSKPAEPVGIGSVCQQPRGSLVATEGYLVLPNFMTTITNYGKRENTKTYQLFLVDQPDAKGESVRTLVSGKKAGERNGIRELPPTGYSFKDLHIYTDDGSAVGPGVRLKVTGNVNFGNDGKCDLVASKIEA